ncbi:hypothetical protein B9K05_12960 [Acetobacter syzygii]|uniref:Integration host factor n=1 Tax=Acetobacter syzygii TaxID=146476 RepID=A0A270B7C6_9PROT|nr:HU family DNA-binding protein [Acetobacter syzygii]PAL20551.1 hypothetical protein B9K05_12960 [Acetobacter syzygii]PAL21097.1 hypothetical protein B9K04_13070 [Acetobacter syzygii]
MSKAFIAAVLQDSIGCTAVAAGQATNDLIDAIVEQISKEGFFTLPSFGNFSKKIAKGGQRMNPRTGEKVIVEDHFTVRFKASPILKLLVADEVKSRAIPISAKSAESKGKSVSQTKKRASVSAAELVVEKPRRSRKAQAVLPVVAEPVVAAPVRRKPGPKPGSKRVTKTTARSGR